VYNPADGPPCRRISRPVAAVRHGVLGMSKEKNKGGKEVRKPKKEKPKTNASAPSTKWSPTKS
jgi:hypothetical protein